MAKTYCIYGLIDPRDKKIFYIGKTANNPLIRFDQHMQDCEGMSPKQERIRGIYESEIGVPELVVLEDNILTDKSAFTREVFWIEMFYMVGAKLTNASIDFNGRYFLSEYHLNNFSDGTIVSQEIRTADEVSQNKKSIWKIDLETKEQDNSLIQSECLDEEFFKIENCKTLTPIDKVNQASKLDFVYKRSVNSAAGRLKNSGLPITKEEILEVINRFLQGDSLNKLEKYFQRSKNSIRYMLDQNGYNAF